MTSPALLRTQIRVVPALAGSAFHTKMSKFLKKALTCSITYNKGSKSSLVFATILYKGRICIKFWTQPIVLKQNVLRSKFFKVGWKIAEINMFTDLVSAIGARKQVHLLQSPKPVLRVMGTDLGATKLPLQTRAVVAPPWTRPWKHILLQKYNSKEVIHLLPKELRNLSSLVP